MDPIDGSVWSFSQFRTVRRLTPSGAAHRVQIDRQCKVNNNLARRETIAAAHVAEAIQYGELDRAV